MNSSRANSSMCDAKLRKHFYKGKIMNQKDTWLLDYKESVFSQMGEDGIIKKILELLPERNLWCVEFGAWDGKYLSNVCNLILNNSYSAVLIEASKEKFGELKSNFRNFKNVHLRNQFVGFSADNNLDTILRDTPIPVNFDLLSIDIDGNDYHVWKSVNNIRQKLSV